MDYSEILDFLAPCGLSCRKCFAYTKGEIAFHGKKLQELLGNFDVYAKFVFPAGHADWIQDFVWNLGTCRFDEKGEIQVETPQE